MTLINVSGTSNPPPDFPTQPLSQEQLLLVKLLKQEEILKEEEVLKQELTKRIRRMEVTLNIYDLSGGLARQMSMAMVGKQFDGIWHTGVVVYGKEIFFGGGIQTGVPGRTPYGFPVSQLSMGTTHIPEDVCMEFLQEIGPRFTFETYNILGNNCNNFSNE